MSKKIKGILIDPIKKEVTEVELEKGLGAIYKVMDCRMFSIPIVFENEDAMYCDYEALLLPDEKIKPGIMMPDWAYPISGEILILGTDEEGNSVNAKSKIEDLPKIRWISKESIQHYKDQLGI